MVIGNHVKVCGEDAMKSVTNANFEGKVNAFVGSLNIFESIQSSRSVDAVLFSVESGTFAPL